MQHEPKEHTKNDVCDYFTGRKKRNILGLALF